MGAVDHIRVKGSHLAHNKGMGSRRSLLVLLLLSSFPVAAANVTFSEHIAPVLFKNCTGCHRPGEAAPFALMNYQDAKKHGRVIAAVTQSRFMPPWKAAVASYPYRDERRLSNAEIDLIAAWVKLGMPEGDTKKTPALPAFPTGWQLGPPDLVVKLPQPFAVPADGPDIYRNFVIPIELAADQWVQAIELRPSSRSVVHHVLYFADTSGEARKMAAETGGFNGMKVTRGTLPLGGWAVGAQPQRLPHGLALKLPKGSALVMQYHFHPTGKAETEESTIGLYFAKAAPERTLSSIQLPAAFGLFAGLRIPPGDESYTVKESFVLPVDVEAIGVAAHAHYIAKHMKLTATFPDGQVKTLLAINDWDFAWQDRYLFADYVSLPKGTRLDGEVSWDNSTNNPRNPSSPPIEVTWGEQSKDEMGSVSLQVVPRQQADLTVLLSAYRQHTLMAAVEGMRRDPTLREKLMTHFGVQIPVIPPASDKPQR